jgi:signal transduction histidine kinase
VKQVGAPTWPLRVAISIGSVLAASFVSIVVRPLTHAAASPLFVAAVTASAWLGGLGAGLLATLLATVALDAVMASTWPSLTLSEEAVAQLAVFVFVALFVSALDHARRRAESQREELLERERSARADAEEANRAKDEFVTIVAHELRTPLTAILSWSAAMSDARLGPALASRALEAIRRNATLQARVIADLVDLSRLGRGRLALQLDAVDLRGVVGAAVEALTVTATSRGIKVVTDLSAASPPVYGDAARLQQVVCNLLGNAIKHSDCGTSVYVTLDTVAATARIAVRDEGHGIAPELLPHVFEPYQQGEGGAASSGLGLGLAIVRQLVELHGGRVEASSRGLGHGACFTVSLPTMSRPHDAGVAAISPTTRTRTRSELPGR